MTDTLVYTLSNETTGLDSKHDSLNAALDAVNDRVRNSDIWVIREASGGRPQIPRWVAAGRGRARIDDDMPARDRRGAVHASISHL